METIQLIHCDDADGIVNHMADDLKDFNVQCVLLRDILNHPPLSSSSSSASSSAVSSSLSSSFSSDKTNSTRIDVFLVTPMFESALNSYDDAGRKHLFANLSKTLFVFYQANDIGTVGVRTMIMNAVGNSKIESLTVGDEDLEEAVSFIKTKISDGNVRRKLPKPGLRKFMVQPSMIYPCQNEVLIIFLSRKYVKDTDSVSIRLANNSLHCDKKGTSEVWSFSAKDLMEGDNIIDVMINDQVAGQSNVRVMDKMDALGAILSDVINPIHFLSQTIGLYPADSLKELDLDLADRLARPNATFSKLFEDMPCPEIRSNKEIPTILHLGAKFGLSTFCKGLSEIPGFKTAMQIVNVHDCTPVHIADQHGHHLLARELMQWEKEEDITALPSPTVYSKAHSSRSQSDNGPIFAYSGSSGSSSGSSTSSGRFVNPSADSGNGSIGSVRTVSSNNDPKAHNSITRNVPSQQSTMGSSLSAQSSRLHLYEEIQETPRPYHFRPPKNHIYDEPWTSDKLHNELSNIEQEGNKARVKRTSTSSSTNL